MHYKRNLLPALLLASLALGLGACASSAKRSAGFPAAGTYAVSTQNKLGAVTVDLSPAAREKLKDNLKFDQEKLRAHLERALAAYDVLALDQKGRIPALAITVTDIRVRSNFSAVMWGALAGADSIDGEVSIVDPQGQVRDRVKVSASYALGGIAGGQDDARMGWLYESFAKEAVKVLVPQPAPVASK